MAFNYDKSNFDYINERMKMLEDQVSKAIRNEAEHLKATVKIEGVENVKLRRENSELKTQIKELNLFIDELKVQWNIP